MDYGIDPGMSSLFSSRLSHLVQDPETSETGQASSSENTPTPRQFKEQPDILGCKAFNARNLVEQALKTSMHQDTGAETLLFPFLLLEAKREEDAEGFQSTEMQTAMPIRHALSLQYELAKLVQRCGNSLELPGGPFAWFFAYCGDD